MAVRLAIVLALGIAGAASADGPGFRPLQDWPLGRCDALASGARTCLDAPALWARFGHGAPEIEVAVVETWATHAMPQILSQHPWLSHLDIPVFWHVQRDQDLPVVNGQTLPMAERLAVRQPQHATFCQLQPRHPTCLGGADDADAAAEAALGYLAWQGRSNHELKMIGLIAGQDVATMRRSGLAPLGAVSLHYIETTPSPQGLSRLAARLDARPGARVVNFSNQGPPDEMLDLHYARVFRTALALNAGRPGRTGDDPGDRLLVASSANTTGTRPVRRALPPPNRFVPPEAVVRESAATQADIVRADAQVAHLLGAPDVPVLVVGGIGATGQIYAEARVEPMIDLYAPGGMTEFQIVRTRGGRSTMQRAREAHGAVRAMQACAEVAQAVQPDGVPTLDWGPADDIRSARMATQARTRWVQAEAVIGAPDIGCAPGQSDIYLARAIGNSVSTALVSAVAAAMFALDPQLSAREARDILRDTARANRVNGLPVLDAEAALRTVLARLVARHVDTSLVPRLRGRAVDAALRPVSPPDALPAPGAVRLRASAIRSLSLAPGRFGQTAWQDMRDDPPLRIIFEIDIARAGAGAGPRCARHVVTLETEAARLDGALHRRIRSERIGPPLPCSDPISGG